MKNFSNLEFKDHPVSSHLDKQAVIEFENGYGMSVINGASAYCGKDTFEVAILYLGELTYNTHITDDVLSYQSPEQISEVMKQIQEL